MDEFLGPDPGLDPGILHTPLLLRKVIKISARMTLPLAKKEPVHDYTITVKKGHEEFCSDDAFSEEGASTES